MSSIAARSAAEGGWGGGHPRSPAAGQGPNGFRVVDVWESEEAARQFGEKLAPIMQELNISAEPEVYPAHTFVAARTLVSA
jgi:hypothetical protein